MLLNPLTQQPIPDDDLKELSGMLESQLALERDIERLEKALDERKDTLRKLSEEIIPSQMETLGLSELKLADGTKVEVKPFYNASISADKAADAFDWLRENGFGEIIKRDITCRFGKGQDEEAADLIKVLTTELGISPLDKTYVHPQTLKAFVREQIEAGYALPTDLLGVFVGKRTKLTPAK